MLLLRVTTGAWAPPGCILDAALRGRADWKAQFASAFIGGAVGVKKVLAVGSEVKKKSIRNDSESEGKLSF